MTSKKEICVGKIELVKWPSILKYWKVTDFGSQKGLHTFYCKAQKWVFLGDGKFIDWTFGIF